MDGKELRFAFVNGQADDGSEDQGMRKARD